MALAQKQFRNHKFNVYLLNSMALKIQHWFFGRYEAQQLQKTEATPKVI